MPAEQLPELAEAKRFSHCTRAVVVGVSDYAGTGQETLPACAPEAARLTEALTAATGCAVPKDQVELLIDDRANRGGILAALQLMIEAATPADMLMFYFAGHGLAQGDQFVLATGSRDPEPGVKASDMDAVFTRSRARGCSPS